MNIFKNILLKSASTNSEKLRARYYLAKEVTDELRLVGQAYINCSSTPYINKDNYLSLIGVFEKLAAWIKEIPGFREADFLRNLPVAGRRGSEVMPDIDSHIIRERKFIMENEATATMGYYAIQNIDACLNLLPHDAPVDDVMKSLNIILKRIGAEDVK